MKYFPFSALVGPRVSLPVWGEWIEIRQRSMTFCISGPSLPVWGEWIEIGDGVELLLILGWSLPVWGEWIEIAAAAAADIIT